MINFYGFDSVYLMYEYSLFEIFMFDIKCVSIWISCSIKF